MLATEPSGPRATPASFDNSRYERIALRRPLRLDTRFVFFMSGASASMASFFMVRFISASQRDRASCGPSSWRLFHPSSCATRSLLHVFLHRESLGFHVAQKLFFLEIGDIMMRLEEWGVGLAIDRELHQPMLRWFFQFQDFKTVAFEFWVSNAVHTLRV